MKGFIPVSVMYSAVKSFVLLSSFSDINLISLSKQDCLIYFNYWKCQIHETMTIFFSQKVLSRWNYFKSLFSISQILDTKLTIKIRVMKMLGKWNQKSGLLTELWIKLSTVKRFNNVAVKPNNSQTCYKRRLKYPNLSEFWAFDWNNWFIIFWKAFLPKKFFKFRACHDLPW